MNYLFSFALLCSTFFLSFSLSLCNATLVITKVLNNTPDFFALRIRNTTGTCIHESIVPAHAAQNVTITLLEKDQPHAYIIKAPLNTQVSPQEIYGFIHINTDLTHKNKHDFIYRDRSIAYITQPVERTARTLYACIPKNPYNLNWWYLGIPLKQSHYAFYTPGKQHDTFYYLPFNSTNTCSIITCSSDSAESFITATRVILCFHDDQLITVHPDC